MYDSLEVSKKTENLVVNGSLKKYYRFRATHFYGGISTADTVGCNLRCCFCWSSNSVWNASKVGEFYSPEQIAEKLIAIAYNKNFNQLRISGGEPTIGKKHLIGILEKIPQNMLFILETNGILLGYDKEYVKDLSKFKNLHVRVCLKGADEKEFQFLTGAKNGFEYQLKALEHLNDEKISFNIALVSKTDTKQDLYNKLSDMNLERIMIEEEEIKLYPKVRKRLEKQGILSYFEK